MQRPVTAVLLCAGVNGLGAVRSLARAGVQTAVVFAERRNPVRYSRYPLQRHHVGKRFTDESLLELLSLYRGSGAVILSCSDEWADFLSRQAEALRAFGLLPVTPPGEVAEILNDKAREIDRMSSVGNIALPRSLTEMPATPEEMLSALPLPIIIKPQSYKFMHVIPTKNIIVRTEQDVHAFYGTHGVNLHAFIAQEVIEGPDETLWVCHSCFADGEMKSTFSFQRIRMSPPHFGVTTFAVSRHNAAIKAMSARIGKALAYTGPAMLEFKYHAGRDEYCYIETNPRLGMCNILDTTSGVNTAATAYRIARGELAENAGSAQAFAEQTDGVYYLNFYGDVYSRLDDGEPIGAILSSYVRTLGSRHAWAYFHAGDPLPWLVTTWQQTTMLLRGVSRKLFGRRTWNSPQG